MLKNKLFLQGLGLGLIAGALLLQMMFAVDAAKTAALQTDETTVNESTYAPTADNETLYTEAQVEEAKRQAAEEALRLHSAANQSPEAGQDDGTNESSAKKKGVYIPQGLDGLEIADILFDFGIIDDKAEFIEQVSKQSLNKSLQFGYYEFDGTPELKDVIQKITTK